MTSAPHRGDQVDVTGPLFLSYRHNDGSEIVADLAWLLRAAGVPVWRDQDDLPPGDTEDRLAEALSDGLSGGVLVVTKDVVNSKIVRQIEAEELIRLHRSDPHFQLLIANDIRSESGKVDYTAPDRLLSRVREELKTVDQRGTTSSELLRLTKTAVSHRMTQHRERVASNGYFELTVQTRNVAQVYDRTGAQLDIRVRPSTHERLPNPEGLRDLQDTLSSLPDAVVTAGAREVRISGGAHLSVAFALGAALPSSRVGTISVYDQRGEEWNGRSEPTFSSTPLVTSQVQETSQADSGRAHVLAYVDLLPTRSDPAFERFIRENPSAFAAIAIIRSANDGLIRPADADALAAEVTAHIRDVSGTHGNAAVDLLLRCPFPLAVLIGRLSNTLRVRVFEWDDSEQGDDVQARYTAALSIHASAPSGPITDVLLKVEPSSTSATPREAGESWWSSATRKLFRRGNENTNSSGR